MKCLWLFTTSIRTRSDDGKHRKRIAPLHIAFSRSRNAALFERKVWQYTTLTIKLDHCTLSEIKTQVFTLSDVLACVSIHRADQKSTLKTRSFLNKNLLIIRLLHCKTFIDIANEYMQACNTGAGVKTIIFVVCVNVNVQVILFFW